MNLAGIYWEEPRAGYVLPGDEVHVWRAKIDWPAETIERWRQMLSLDEKLRADKFHVLADRIRFIIGRSVSRILIGHCLGLEAAKVIFTYGPKGKPGVEKGISRTPLKFNVSHSGDFVLVALGYGRELGVDIERIRTDFDPAIIAKRFFSEAESKVLAALPAGIQPQAFFTCWTRKESYLKARGDGLSLALDRFDVAFAPGEEARLLDSRYGESAANKWTLRNIEVGKGYEAALAVEGTGVRIRTWDWPGELPK